MVKRKIELKWTQIKKSKRNKNKKIQKLIKNPQKIEEIKLNNERNFKQFWYN